MVALCDDPNEQLQLGEYYYQLDSFEKALDCFSWEMELNPDNPEPVRWLSKLYQKLDRPQEAKTYQNLYSTMQGS